VAHKIDFHVGPALPVLDQLLAEVISRPSAFVGAQALSPFVRW
jgi:hypothetical protein